MKELSKTWWQSTACYANRWYAISILLVTLLAFSIPNLLGPFIPCAEFIEVEWVVVAFGCLAGVGLLNILFSFAPFIEQVLPQRGTSPMRVLLLIVLPLLFLTGIMWFTFQPFWYALLENPDLLCD
ncbi:MAG: hypothetical protein B7Y56_15840 [Gallionellales bacterium 35-53-114]|nr:MAG: hypothetical protein B7Y56_15840 [Gallionellales bacterium 35-53-114]HQS60028.1 hypothetical protein [Gallionellaceae bacterium]